MIFTIIVRKIMFIASFGIFFYLDPDMFSLIDLSAVTIPIVAVDPWIFVR